MCGNHPPSARIATAVFLIVRKKLNARHNMRRAFAEGGGVFVAYASRVGRVLSRTRVACSSRVCRTRRGGWCLRVARATRARRKRDANATSARRKRDMRATRARHARDMRATRKHQPPLHARITRAPRMIAPMAVGCQLDVSWMSVGCQLRYLAVGVGWGRLRSVEVS